VAEEEHGNVVRWLAFIGLTLVALGTGGIKPCVPAFGGDQFTADQVGRLFLRHLSSPVRGGSTGGQGGRHPQWKMWPPVAPYFGPGSLDFHLNRPVISLIQLQNTPVISLIQLHIVPPHPSWNCSPPLAPIWLVPEPPLSPVVWKRLTVSFLTAICC